MLAAVSLGLPTLIHEQNAVLGRANRLLAPLVRGIATGFPDTKRLRPADRARAVHTGNPVRPASTRPRRRSLCSARPDQPIELVILGGSQGAHILGRCSSRRPRDIAETIARTAADQPASPP